ncbi:hypothetical protein A4X09_0g3862 [Tilletia walkeri]|uniref:Uncharacterized protein n=1 Tax=Tilletia walkeri TaxID=117179 RepID=A0A8X7N764_9BASI|nr:hypothetical protein A4X09_0g3862 [Tilletia walkeri]
MIKQSLVVEAKTSAKAVAKQLKHGEAYDASRSAVYKEKAAIFNEPYGDKAKSFGPRTSAYIHGGAHYGSLRHSLRAQIERR